MEYVPRLYSEEEVEGREGRVVGGMLKCFFS